MPMVRFVAPFCPFWFDDEESHPRGHRLMAGFYTMWELECVGCHRVFKLTKSRED